jgi:uncharacterized protein YbjT (DUF2867 family)
MVGSRARALKENVPEIELVVADLDDVNSLEKAFDRAYGVFGLTDFWEHGYDGEVRQGKKLVDAAKAVGVKHFVYSTFVGEHSDVPHFDSKLEVDGILLSRYATDNGRILEGIWGSSDVIVYIILFRDT